MNNSTKPNNKVRTIPIDDIDSHLYKNKNMVVDFSFEGAFASCKCGDFNNFLKDNQAFIEKFRMIIEDIHNLSQNPINKIMSDKGYRHCHKSNYEQKAANVIKVIFSVIGKDENSFDQIVGGEDIYQIGFQSEIRLFGTVMGNVFRVCFIDYYHDFEFDERRNDRNKKYCNFCAVNSEIRKDLP